MESSCDLTLFLRCAAARCDDYAKGKQNTVKESPLQYKLRTVIPDGRCK